MKWAKSKSDYQLELVNLTFSCRRRLRGKNKVFLGAGNITRSRASFRQSGRTSRNLYCALYNRAQEDETANLVF